MMRAVVIVLLLFCVSLSSAQDSIFVTDGFQLKPDFTSRKVVSTVAIGGLLVTSLIWSYDTWWRDAGREFNFKTENWLNGYFLGIDKIGHFYTSYFYFNTFRNVMLWGGYERSTADWWAAGAAAFFALAIEVGDGVTPYGFDYQDIVFNFAGIGYGWLQTRVPFLTHFDIKWSYVPPEGYKLPVRITDNYDAHTYWLTCDIDKLLPSSVEPYWPDFLQIAVGVGVDDKVTKRELVVGFDLNLEELFHTENEDLLLIERTVNMFHVPAPAIKFTETKEPRYYLFHRN
ncbi:MAG: DUF2279 domain-containing protein [Bacteroidota bacterium]